ncbi:hypothetical protein [Nonomuraea sp. NPDC005692]
MANSVGQRYADTEDEYEIILDRHHRVLAAQGTHAVTVRGQTG